MTPSNTVPLHLSIPRYPGNELAVYGADRCVGKLLPSVALTSKEQELAGECLSCLTSQWVMLEPKSSSQSLRWGQLKRRPPSKPYFYAQEFRFYLMELENQRRILIRNITLYLHMM